MVWGCTKTFIKLLPLAVLNANNELTLLLLSSALLCCGAAAASACCPKLQEQYGMAYEVIFKPWFTVCRGRVVSLQWLYTHFLTLKEIL